MASESTKNNEPSSYTHQTNERHSTTSENEKIISNNNKIVSHSNDVKAKENEIRKVKDGSNESPSKKKEAKVEGIALENVLNVEKKCAKGNMPDTTKNDQKGFFGAGVTHDVVFLEAASKNSGVIQNE